MIVNIFALMCVAYAINHLGTMTASLFMSLGEVVSSNEIASIIGCSLGLMLYARGRWW